ncbi:hypothetical protein GCM10010466_55170 [Planomonospora alba]|uniref:Uncharacterized protein n=1 Tax=Planomonospora alba TaxID=161354 RepID=A0ABP6NSL3_9ACTN
MESPLAAEVEPPSAAEVEPPAAVVEPPPVEVAEPPQAAVMEMSAAPATAAATRREERRENIGCLSLQSGMSGTLGTLLADHLHAAYSADAVRPC